MLTRSFPATPSTSHQLLLTQTFKITTITTTMTTRIIIVIAEQNKAYCGAGTIPSPLYTLTSLILPQPQEVGAFMNSVSQRSNVRHREVKQLARGLTACSKRQSWDSNPGCLTLETTPDLLFRHEGSPLPHFPAGERLSLWQGYKSTVTC